MRIVIIGNCQVSSIAAALNNSGLVQADCAEIAVLRSTGNLGFVASSMPAYDWIIVQDLDVLDKIPDYAPFKIDTLKAITPNVVVLPTISYTGLHPDCTAIHDPAAGVMVRTPAGEYSSRLIAASFSMGLSADRCEKLFNSYIYSKLGYFDEAAKARAFLVEYSRKCGMDLSDVFDQWFGKGLSFMHTFNHPAAFALEGLARLLADRIGIPGDLVNLDEDILAINTIWPVYPEIASRLGVKGSLVFKPPGVETRLSLREMIDGSYDVYSRHPEAVANTLSVALCKTALAAALSKSYNETTV